MAELLTEEQRNEQLPDLGPKGWGGVPERDAIRKVYMFANFVDAWGWMTMVAIFCEKQNHHPEWLNVYRTVDVTLTTHDAGGLTDLDLRVANKMDELAEHFIKVSFQEDLAEPIACLCGTPDAN